MKRVALIVCLAIGSSGCTAMQRVGSALSSPAEQDAEQERWTLIQVEQMVEKEREARRRAHADHAAAARLDTEQRIRRKRIEKALVKEVSAELVSQSPLRSGQVVALFTAETSATFDPTLLDTFDALLFLEIAKTDRFRFVPRADIVEAARSMKRASLSACFDDRCAIEIGRALAAEQVLVPSLYRADDDTCFVALALYDLRTETGIWGATTQTTCDARGFKEAAVELGGHLALPAEKIRRRPMVTERAPKKPDGPKRPPRQPFTAR